MKYLKNIMLLLLAIAVLTSYCENTPVYAVNGWKKIGSTKKYSSTVEQVGPMFGVSILSGAAGLAFPKSVGFIISICAAGGGAVVSLGQVTYIKSVQYVDSKSYKNKKYDANTSIKTVHYIYKNSNYTGLIKKETSIKKLREYYGGSIEGRIYE